MPHFDGCGHQVCLCQKCGASIPLITGKELVWRSDITGNESAGNVCLACLERVTFDLSQVFDRAEQRGRLLQDNGDLDIEDDESPDLDLSWERDEAPIGLDEEYEEDDVDVEEEWDDDFPLLEEPGEVEIWDDPAWAS